MERSTKQQQKNEGESEICLKVFAWLMVVTYMAVIFYFSHQSAENQPIKTTNANYLLHFLEYAGLGVLLSFGFHTIKRASPRNILGFGGFYAATDEVHQYFVPTRVASLGDWVADWAGVAAGFILTNKLINRIR
ncbi:MAG: VanZ family protein [Candidatus Altiarchaeales archaeon]|nr:VanZ family protein [Candidatus Altiarchaeales archaeon]